MRSGDAFWLKDLDEFVLPYEVVRISDSPELRSTLSSRARKRRRQTGRVGTESTLNGSAISDLCSATAKLTVPFLDIVGPWPI